MVTCIGTVTHAGNNTTVPRSPAVPVVTSVLVDRNGYITTEHTLAATLMTTSGHVVHATSIIEVPHQLVSTMTSTVSVTNVDNRIDPLVKTDTYTKMVMAVSGIIRDTTTVL